MTDEQRYYSAPLRLRATGRNVSGYLVRYDDVGMTTEGAERILPGAFDPLDDGYYLNLNHASESIITKNLQVRSVDGGIEISTQLANTELANEVLAGIVEGRYNGFSAEFYDRDIGHDGDVRLVKRARLMGASIVEVPAFRENKLQLRSGKRRRVNPWLM